MTPFPHLKRWRRFIPGMLACLCVLLFAACSSDSPTRTAAPAASPAGSSAPSVLRIATSPAFAPFEFKTADGQLTGFDIDLINAIGEAAGFVIDFDEEPFDDIIRGLYSGDIDAAISAITITEVRANRVSFSRPYYKSGLAIAVRANNTDITSAEALNGKQVGVQSGTTGADKAQQLSGVRVKSFTTVPQALQELAAGNLDAVINDAPVTAYAIKSGSVSGLKLLDPLLSEDYYGIALPKQSPNLNPINSGLSTILKNGAYRQIYQKWFGTEPPQLPETIPL